MNKVQIKGVINALYATDFPSFCERAFKTLSPAEAYVWGPHVAAICYALLQVALGKCKRLLIVLPPRHLKSHIVSVCFPAWLLGRNPSTRIICASYNTDLAYTFSAGSRKIMQTSWYKAAFPNTRFDPKKIAEDQFRTTKNGFRIATSVSGTLTGKGGNVLIFDDLLKATDAHSETARANVQQWFQTTAATRLDNPKEGAIIIVAQRLHEDDLIGNLIAQGTWQVLELPAIAHNKQVVPLTDEVDWTRKPGELLHPTWMGQKELNRAKAEMGTAAFEAQFQQRPTPAGGNVFKLEWFKRYEEPLPLEQYEMIIQSWDTAAEPGETNDYSVCLTFGVLGKKFHLLDAFRQKLNYPDLRHACYDLQKKYQARVVIVEKASSGISLYQDIRNAGHDWIFNLGPEKGKVPRAHQQSAKIEQGQVYLSNEASWLEAFENEVTAFPNGKYDDQVDALTQFLRALEYNHHPLCELSIKKG